MSMSGLGDAWVTMTPFELGFFLVKSLGRIDSGLSRAQECPMTSWNLSHVAEHGQDFHCMIWGQLGLSPCYFPL